MKPSIPKGTRDFSPAEVAKRQYIIQKMRTHFEKFGFQPIETPSFENSETLMGKYGEEGDRLIFKILNSGDFLKEYNVFLLEEIKNAIFNLKESIGLKGTFGQLDENYINLFKKNFADRAKNKNSRINSEEFVKDLWDFIYTSFLNKEDKFEEFKKASESKLKDYVMRIFAEFYNNDRKDIGRNVSEKALRYDLTVPFARYVVQHQNEIEFPFKRYQIQPVWRADRPQKGRFREFYQCDADVVGSTSLWQEVELVQLYDSVFTDLGLNGVTIKINNRKILSGIAEVIGASDKLIDFTVALDKLDKIGEDGVKKEMIEKGISETAIEKVQPLFNFTGSITEKIEKLSVLLSESIEGMKGVEELQFICDNVSNLGLSSAILDLDVTLARGLNYYTGAIFEVAPPKAVSMGSIGGGGRYDDLTGIFGLKNMSGVGISFGLDRIYLVIEELGLFPETVTTTSKAIFLNFGQEETKYSMKAITELRKLGAKVELYPDNVKIAKQFQYADKRGIQLAIIVGDDEMKNNQFSVKNLVSGEQQKVSFEELKKMLQ
ncbi:histidine--tRNA ligase [Flavobacterium sp.]|uniref:histidine--tRNA ligase n=1 Tax=Flavobacterium sp. TaxID=239 RepID=UPI0038FD1627